MEIDSELVMKMLNTVISKWMQKRSYELPWLQCLLPGKCLTDEPINNFIIKVQQATVLVNGRG